MEDPRRWWKWARARAAGNATVRTVGLLVLAIGAALAAWEAAVWLPMLLVGLLLALPADRSGILHSLGLLVLAVGLLACLVRAAVAVPVLLAGLLLVWLARPDDHRSIRA